MDRKKAIRIGCAVGLAALMGVAAGVAGEREMLFPEAAALTVGLWIIDKPVWRVRRWQVVVLMFLGALAGIGLTNFSPLPLPCNLCLAFLFAATCLVVSRTTLVPLLSASLLPVLLGTRTGIYPVAVLGLTTVLVTGQWAMERAGLRRAKAVAAPFPDADRPKAGPVVQEKGAADADCMGLSRVGAVGIRYTARTSFACGQPDGMPIPEPHRNLPVEGSESSGDLSRPYFREIFLHGPARKAGQCVTTILSVSREAEPSFLLTSDERNEGKVPQTKPLPGVSSLGSGMPRVARAAGSSPGIAVPAFREGAAQAGTFLACDGQIAEMESLPGVSSLDSGQPEVPRWIGKAADASPVIAVPAFREGAAQAGTFLACDRHIAGAEPGVNAFHQADAHVSACPPLVMPTLQAEGRDSLPATAHRSQGLHIGRWLAMAVVIGLVAWLADATYCPYLILPPLVVTFVEMVTSKAGFRTRPVQVFGLLTAAAVLGTASRLAMEHLGLPLSLAAAGSVMCLFGIFEGAGGYFAPAAAMALVPLLVPVAGIAWLPVQAAAGAALLLSVALVGFLRCGRWPRAQRWACFVPQPIRKRRRRALKTSSEG